MRTVITDPQIGHHNSKMPIRRRKRVRRYGGRSRRFRAFRRYRRRAYRGRRRMGRSAVPRNILRFPLPQTLKCKLRYVKTTSLDAVTDGINQLYWSANSLQDPSTSGSAEQPTGFDELSALYGTYQVLGSKMRCMFQNTDASTAQWGGITLVRDAAIPSISTRDILLAQTMTKRRYLTVTSVQTRQVWITYGCNPAKVMQRHRLDKDLRADIADNPVAQPYYKIWVTSALTGPNPAAVNLYVSIDYVAVFTNPKALVSA